MPALERVPVVLRGPEVSPFQVEGWALPGKPGLAVTEAHRVDPWTEWRLIPNEFFVTHIDSGYRLGEKTLDYTTAIRVLEALCALDIDWTRPQDYFTQGEKALARATLHRFVV